MAQSEAEEEKAYDLSLSGNGISVKQKLSQAVAYRVIAVLMGGVGTSASPQRQGSAPSNTSGSAAPPPTSIGQSLREYMDSAGAKRNPEKILAIAKYLIENEGRNVKPSEIKGEFSAAAEPLPANYGRDFRWAVQVGWLAEERQNRGHYYVTANGEEALRERFSDEIRKRTKMGMGVRRRRRRRNAVVANETEE